MQQYIIRRSLLNIVVLFLVATMVFGVLRIDSDQVIKGRAGSCFQNTGVGTEEERAVEAQRCRDSAKDELGLDASLPTQYWNFMSGVVQGDLGKTFSEKESVLREIGARATPSIELGLLQILVALAVALPVGVISAIRQDQPVDYGLRFFAIFFLGIPSFIVGTLLIAATNRFDEFVPRWLGPANEWVDIWENPLTNLKLMAGPALVGGLATGAIIMRFLRSQMLEVMRQDYVRTAWAKGLRERTVVLRHALKNAFIPVLTVVGLLLAAVISGNVILETLWNIPGLGYFVTVSAVQSDYPVMQGIVLVVALLLVFVNLLIDISYGWLDPRIRYS